MYWLVVVTFLGGNAWGPMVESTAMPNAEACKQVGIEVASSILAVAKTNLVGVTPEVIDERGSKVILRGERQVARVSCVAAPEVAKDL